MVGTRRNALLHRLFLMLLLLPAAGGTAVGQQRFELQREAMVQKSLEAEGIRNPRVLEAMRKVPRHEFVRTADRARSYEDTALPIGNQQTISPPYVVAYMTEVLDPGPEDRVLEIGTGSGYQAAVLGAICRDVYTIEIVPQLAKQATRRLQDLGYENVHVLEGDGYKGWEEHAPFDRIIVTCSPESIPQPLIDQLKEGGRMIIPMGERYQQSFHLLKKENGELQDEKLISTLFVPMTGESEEQRRVQPDPDQPQIVNGGFERDENGDGRVDGWHYQRNARLEAEGAMEGQQYLRFENADPDSLSQALQGTAVNGRRLAGLRLQFWMRCTAVVPGAGPSGQAAVVVHFYDGVRREIGAVVIGRWRGTLDWQDVRTVVQVPAEAKEMIFRIGLNGAVGQLDLDDLKIVPIPR
jgi:protein-L-isoaspartate(D-aspartate) O-methyltransferase